MAKILYEELVRLNAEGLTQRQLAAHFNSSIPAVCKALAKVRRNTGRPAILENLTAKEESFVIEIASGKNQTQAAMAAFECTSLSSAKAIGSRLANDPEIAEAITAVLNAEGLGTRVLVRRLRDHVRNDDPQASLRAVDMSLKLHGAYPATVTKNLNIHADICPVDLSAYGDCSPVMTTTHEDATLIPVIERQREAQCNPNLATGSATRGYDPFATD